MTISDITEGMPYDLSATVESTSFSITSTNYDLTIDDVPFVLNVSNQNPYRRETAQYRKDQFDNSTEPGEQSLTGWWLRSQTSFHNGMGIDYYEPGTDYTNVANRYHDSRGIDVWTEGQASLLNDVFHSYTGNNGIVAVSANDGTSDVLVSGDSAGKLKKVILNGDNVATIGPNATYGYTLFVNGLGAGTQADHNSSYAFKSVTTDGSSYYAACSTAIHKGSSTTADTVIYHLGSTPTTTKSVIRYVKNYLLFGFGDTLYQLNPNETAKTQHSSTLSLPSTNLKKHTSDKWYWVDLVGGNKFVYATGRNNSKSEIWAIPYDDNSVNLNLPEAFVVGELPFGEFVNAMYFYLGFLAIGTNKGMRIAQTSADGSIVIGPLLFQSTANPPADSNIPAGVTGFVANDKFIWASTSVAGDNGNDNGVLIRVDLSSPYEDGTFPYAYDLQYESDKDSYCSGVHFADNRLHLIINEPTESPAGEIQTQKLSAKRTSGWLQTGKIRYGMVEPKYFKYINMTCDTGTNDSITMKVIDQSGYESNLANITVGLSNQDVLLEPLYDKQEQIAFRFIFNNSGGDLDAPILYAYQIKATPATRRQRLYQYPVSCYDIEMDNFGSVFGYKGRAIETIQRLESIEQTGRFVNIVDYRTNEVYQGVIEEVRFTNESSPDKNESGFGGLLIITVRKM